MNDEGTGEKCTVNSDTNPTNERQASTLKMLDGMDDPAYQRDAEQAEAMLTSVENARKRHANWAAIGDGGTAQGLDLKETRFAETQKELDELEMRQQVMRGDFLQQPAAATPVTEAAQSEPIDTPMETASNSSDVEPDSNLPWWKMPPYDIFEMAQNIGARLKSQHKLASNAAISREIEITINNIERNKARNRKSPNHDTIRGVLTGWKWKPD